MQEIIPSLRPLGYPRTYVRVPVDAQVSILKKILPYLDGEEVISRLPWNTPNGIDDFFVIPDDRRVGKSLAEATAFMLYYLGIDTKHVPLDELEREERTVQALRVMRRLYRGDFWLIPGQLGRFYAGVCVEKTRRNLEKNEFGLDFYLSAAALVTHPGRLTGESGELGIDCSGNADFNGNGSPKIPCLNSFLDYSVRRRRCLMRKVSEPDRSYGPATGFIPGMRF